MGKLRLSRRLRRPGLRSVAGLVGAAFVASGVFLDAPSASADNFGATNCITFGSSYQYTECVSRANNSAHVVKLDGSFGTNNWYDIPNMDTAVRDRLSNTYDPTVLTAYVNQNDPYPDVVAADYNWEGTDGVVGWAFCPSYNTGTGGSGTNTWCRGQRIFFSSWWYWNTTLLDTWEARHFLACHELGHTLGLRHNWSDGDSCMRTGESAWNTRNRFLSAHDRDHINASY